MRHSGRPTLTNLYAIGETAYTGLHGANRYASNCLLNVIVFCTLRRSSHFLKKLGRKWHYDSWIGDESKVQTSDERRGFSTHNWQEGYRRFMWDLRGIVRTDKTTCFRAETSSRFILSENPRIFMLITKIFKWLIRMPVTLAMVAD